MSQLVMYQMHICYLSVGRAILAKYLPEVSGIARGYRQCIGYGTEGRYFSVWTIGQTENRT